MVGLGHRLHFVRGRVTNWASSLNKFTSCVQQLVRTICWIPLLGGVLGWALEMGVPEFELESAQGHCSGSLVIWGQNHAPHLGKATDLASCLSIPCNMLCGCQESMAILSGGASLESVLSNWVGLRICSPSQVGP